MNPQKATQQSTPGTADGWCNSEDCLRAFFCAQAVLWNQNIEIEGFLKQNQIQFTAVHVSLALPSGLKFLVAYADDATFISFSGLHDFQNIGSDQLMASPISSSYILNKEISELADEFMGSDYRTLFGLSNSKKRIIFCGHRLGGAVAHMVVLRFWTENVSSIQIEEHPNTLISIAFGAPFICNSKFAEEVNIGNEHLKSHFFNFLLENDPLLCVPPAKSAGRNWRVSNTSTDQLEEPPFYSIGIHTLMKGDQQSNSAHFSQLSVHLRSKIWTQEKFFDSYKSALVEGKHLFLPEGCSGTAPVTTPAPTVTSVRRKALDSKRSFIYIEGNNLLFLREPVKFNGLDPWETKMQTDTELIIFGPSEIDDGTEKPASMIVLKTAFGGTSHLIQPVKENVSDGTPTAVRNLLHQIAQRFQLMATPPLSCLPGPMLLEDLDIIVQCLPEYKGDKLSTLLRAISVSNSEEALRKNIQSINTAIETVIEFLTRSYTLQYVERVGREIMKYLLGGLMLVTIGGIASLLVVTTDTGRRLASGVMAVCIGKNELLIPEYLGVLKIALQEATLWDDEDESVERRQDTAIEESEKSEAVFESLLVKEVERSGSCKLTNMIETINRSTSEQLTDAVQFPKVFKDLTLECKVNLLRKMQIVAKTVSLYNTEVKKTQFVAIVGEEDAGKSTFIKKAIQQYGGESDQANVPEVGFQFHTSVVRPYELNALNLFLVDFPGMNGTGAYAEQWKQFTRLPSSCILLLDFKDDIKQDQVKMYKTFAKEIKGRVTIVFNKVDEKFSPRNEAKYTPEYFTNLRERNVEQINRDCMYPIQGENVHFVSLDPDMSEERCTRLEKVGVLGFEGLAKIVLVNRY